MPHKTRYDKFADFYSGNRINETVRKLPETESCADFHSQEFYIPGVDDLAEYIHRLNLLVKPIREHSLDCKRCAVQLEALLLSQANPKLFAESLGGIIRFESQDHAIKHIHVAGLPWPCHEEDPRAGRIVYVAPKLQVQYAVREFLGRVMEHFGDKIRISKFSYEDKSDGQRKPCHQAKAHLIDAPGYITIRSRTQSRNCEEIYQSILR